MFNQQLKQSLAYNFAFVALAPILFLSIVVLFHLANDTKKEIRDQNLLLAKTVSGQVDVFLHEPISILENIGGMVETNPSWSEDNIQQILDLHIRNSNYFESIFLLNNQGIVENAGLPSGRAEFHPDYIGINLGHLKVYTVATSTHKITWSDTFLSVMTGKISLAVCVPYDDFSLIGNLDIQSLSEYVRSLSEDQGIQVALIDRRGTVIVHPDPIIEETQVNIRNLPIIQKGFEGYEEVSRFTFNNIEYFGSTKIIADPEWLVLVSQTVQRSHHGISATAYSFLIVALVAALLAVLFAIIKSKRIISPITEVANHAKQIAGGNYNVTFNRSQYSEIRELTNSIQHMADAVQSREKELQLSHQRFRQIYNATNEAIFVRNPQTFRLIDANEAMSNLFGYSLDELKELSISELSVGDPLVTKRKAQESIDRALREGTQVLEWNYLRKNGESFWAEVTLTKAEIDGKKRILGVIRDITERKSLERQLAQSQKMEAIGTLAGGIAHDFNNILTPILGYVEMAMIHINNQEKLRKDLHEVLRAVQRAKELVQQILTFSRQEGQQAAPTNVVIIIKEALKLLRSSIPTTIEIRQNIDPGCGPIMANPTQIHQVLMNLCTNAYHAMRENGGTLGVSLTPVAVTAPDNPTLKNLPEGSYLKLEVSDTGHGMEKAVLNRIMEPYYTTKSVDEGTGLGLSVVHGIVKGLGGEITVYSEVGKGSTFHVYLPVIEQTVATTAIDQNITLPKGSECILLVDDEKIILNMQKEMLEHLGYKVQTFSNPEEALHFFSKQESRCELLITDMTMPEMTGIALSEKIREIEPAFPVILCTGFSETIDKEKALAQGINEFLTKPVELFKLAGAVRRVLDKKNTATGKSSDQHTN